MSRKILLLIACMAATLIKNVYAQDLVEFKSPGPSNKAYTYWMFMNGNITKEGITKDLEAMKAAGVEGTYFFSIGYYPKGPVKFMSPEWIDCVAHAMKESARLKMKFGVYNGDGWSMSGGPWMTPEESMKQIVWADTVVQGGKTIRAKLPQPLFNTIYSDISVMAFPKLVDEDLIPIRNVISSTLVQDTEKGFDNNAGTTINFLKAENGKAASAIFDFGKPTDIRRLVFDQLKSKPFMEGYAKLECSNDNISFTVIADKFPVNLKAESTINQLTLNFPRINTRYVRVTVNFVSYQLSPVVFEQNSISFGELKFYESPRINLWEPKSGESKRIFHQHQPVFMKELNSRTNENLPDGYFIDAKNRIDLTRLVDKNGELNWKAPKGEWVIQRVGYTSTDRKNAPSTEGGRGLECNKMDAKAVEKHFNSYTARLNELSLKTAGKPLDYMQLESWEAGIQNWTEGFEKEFERRNGYSIFPYLPVLAGGYVVDSYEASNRFLWDFRNTVSQLIAENYWGTMARCARVKGITVSGEGSGMQHYLYDPIRYHQYLDIPMGEFWPNEGHSRVDIKNASSVAHTYGRNRVGGEAFTSGDTNIWATKPFDLKQIGDEAFTLGANLYVMHTYVHQPFDVAPGFTLGNFGNHFQRLNPWYTKAQGWFNYIARCQYMLRQGKSIQDIAYFTGEGIPAYLGQSWEVHPKLPEGYDYDGVNTDLIKKMVVKDGQLYLPTGPVYKLLVFQDITVMTAELAAEVKRLVAAGANIVSLKPIASPSLSKNSAADKTVKAIADEVWGKIDGQSVKENSYGKGKVYSEVPLDQLLSKLDHIPDFSYSKGDDSLKINFVHRRTPETDIYFLVNYRKNPVKTTGVFRVSNKVPELWDPDKGTSVVLPYKILNGKQIEVQLDFDPLGSMFVVFKPGTKQPVSVLYKEVQKYPLTDPWKVNFESTTDKFELDLDQLSDWSTSKDNRIKYFSGSATYSQDIQLKKLPDTKVELDLGNVNNNIATVKLNGREVAGLWKPPYKADITPYILGGKNRLEIIVTNTAVNSLIGDERFPSDLTYDDKSHIDPFPSWIEHPEQRKSQRKTFVTFKYITSDSKLDPSGLLGPVEIKVSEPEK
ncbi:MAG: glycosyl hydrolase [Daejeonella sp.]